MRTIKIKDFFTKKTSPISFFKIRDGKLTSQKSFEFLEGKPPEEIVIKKNQENEEFEESINLKENFKLFFNKNGNKFIRYTFIFALILFFIYISFDFVSTFSNISKQKPNSKEEILNIEEQNPVIKNENSMPVIDKNDSEKAPDKPIVDSEIISSMQISKQIKDICSDTYFSVKKYTNIEINRVTLLNRVDSAINKLSNLSISLSNNLNDKIKEKKDIALYYNKLIAIQISEFKSKKDLLNTINNMSNDLQKIDKEISELQ